MDRFDWAAAIITMIFWTIVTIVFSEKYPAFYAGGFVGCFSYWIGYFHKSYNIKKKNR